MPAGRGLRRSALLLVVVLAAGGCRAGAGADPSGAAEQVGRATWPDGLTAYVDQSRRQRTGTGLFVRLVNDTDGRVTVTGAAVRWPGSAAASWSGTKSFVNEADLPVDLPAGGCGERSGQGEALVTLTYRLDDGRERRSSTTATDRYGAVALLRSRECGLAALREAADVVVGEPRVVGAGRGSVLELPLTLTPTGRRDDVVWAGVEDTVLFRQAPGSPRVGGVRASLGPGDPPVRTTLRVVPARCDPHALAEDKVGTLFAMRVIAPEVPADAGAYLPLDDDVRAALRRFVPVSCAW